MDSYFEKLKQRWNIQTNRQLIVVFIVFAITGSGSLRLARPILEFSGITDIQNPWIRIPLRILIILPVYQVLLLLVGGIFGQFRFFLNLQKRWFRIRQKS